jgi:hypothetical protein
VASPTLADRLRAARARTFVGRSGELELFREGLHGNCPSFNLLWLHGPGGVGKSALLHRMADDATAEGMPTVLIDAASVEPSPEALRAATSSITVPGRLVLLIDTAELLAPLDVWLRTEFLPALPGDSLIVLAGRHPPGSRWLSDLGWSDRLRVVALRNLEPQAAQEYLARRGIPEIDRPAVIARTYGHPLGLALLSDVWTQRTAQHRASAWLGPDSVHDVISALLERFLDEAPDGVRRRALQVLGHARVTSQSLLRATLGGERADECFDWLRELSFVEVVADGLAPHNLARDVLDDDLRWRDREAWVELHTQIRSHLLARLAGRDVREQARATADLLWFQRRSPALSAYRSWDDVFTLWSQRAKESDLPQILDLVDGYEGTRSVALHQAWWRRQPEAFHVFRSEPGCVHGFLVQLRLDAADGDLPGADLVTEVGDPLAAAAWQLITHHAPLRPGEHARVIRSWIGRDGYHRPTPTHQALTGLTARMWATEPGLAVSVAFAADIDLWTPMFAHVDYARADGADVSMSGRTFGAYLHDWRVTPPMEWIELLDSREFTRRPEPEELAAYAQRHLNAQALLVLSRPDFDAAVRDAFRCAGRPAELARNPLLRSRVLRQHGGEPEAPGAARLRSALEAEVAALREDPRRDVAARALELTYLTSTRTQEAAAARLSLPFSTYRRHLAAGLAAVSASLWNRELQGG